MKHASLFSGIGGFDLAATWMKWENVFNCEKNPFCRRILRHYWPETKSYEDIKEVDATQYRGQIDVLSGGFPCQPFSQAGKRRGTADDRYLWPHMLRVVGEIKPTWVVGENVFGLVNWDGGMVFRKVLSDLENKGYEVWPYLLPAAGVNAPHRRDRIWFVAHASGDGLLRNRETPQKHDRGIQEGMDQGYELDPLYDHGVASDTQGHAPVEGSTIKAAFKSRATSSNADDGWEGRYPWRNFPTQSPVCGVDDGLPFELDRITFSAWRKESLKGYGNAIVPQVAWRIFRVIEQMEKQV
jgi:DNA (cytosine-5)-methyltransferase 1